MTVLSGVFYPYSQATNPGEFDSAIYYRTLEIGGRLRKAQVIACGEDFWPVRNSLYELKCFLKERLYRIFPEKEAAVMSALLLGDKKDLDSEMKDLYKRNGILHILSISSLHITIIGMSVYKLLRKIGLPVCPAAIGGSVLLLLYGGMTGFSMSACRAIGMYLIRMLGEMVGRTYDMLTALGVMGAVMVIRNPYYLQSSGFLLSFSSVLGIGVVYPALSPELPRSVSKASRTGGRGLRQQRLGQGQPFQLWDAIRSMNALLAEKLAEKCSRLGKSLLGSVMASLSITLTTLPIQLWFYYEVPVYSVLLNLFVLPLMKPMMITGLLALLVPGLGILGGIDYCILKSYEFLCGCFDRLPFHTWNPGCPGIWQIVVYYLLLSGCVISKNYMKKSGQRASSGGSAESKGAGLAGVKAMSASFPADKEQGLPEQFCVKGFLWKYRKALVSTCCIPLAVLMLGIRPAMRNSVIFLDVGQGDCILVRTASGENYLFDCGSSSRSGVGKYILLPCLKYNGIRYIDAIFLSHPDADHVNGATELLETGEVNNIQIGQLLLPAIQKSARQEQLGELLAAASNASQESPVPVGYLQAGDGWSCGSAVFTCLHPSEGLDTQDVNGYSECFLVEFSEKAAFRFLSGTGMGESWTMLLTGDVQNEGEEKLWQEIQRRDIRNLTVLKAAHHGSKNSTPSELLEQLSPVLTVISSGRNNRYGHPHAELLERLDQAGTIVVQTAQSGAIVITSRGGKLQVSAFLKSGMTQ